jgi:hypothetical protein
MKRLAWLVVLPVIVLAQTTLTLTGPANAKQGTTVTLTLNLAGSSGQNMAGLQWTATPASSATIASVTAGAAATTAALTPWCSATNLTCLLIGFSTGNVVTTNTVADGVVGTLQLAIPPLAAPGPIAVPLTSIYGVTTGGLNIPNFSSGTPYSITVLSPCDVLGNGSVNIADVQAMINGALGIGSCPLSSTLGGCSLANVFAVIEAFAGKTCTIQ